MATRSIIAVQIQDGFLMCYCHWDGYPEGVGLTLLENYSTFKKAISLVSHGSILSLKETIGNKESRKKEVASSSRVNIITNFSRRDQGEDWKYVSCEYANTEEEVLKFAEESGAEYCYLFSGRTWKVACRGMQVFGFSNGEEFGSFSSLKCVLEEIDKK